MNVRGGKAGFGVVLTDGRTVMVRCLIWADLGLPRQGGGSTMRRMNALARFLPVICCLLVLAACTRERNRWQPPAEPAAGTPVAAEPAPVPLVEKNGDRIVLFAPLAIGPLAEGFPDAKLEFPYEMAKRVDLLMRGFDGRVGETLPVSFAARWDEGRVPATGGCAVVVLSRVNSITMIKGSSGTPPVPDRYDAEVEMRVLNVDGKAIYHKRAIGSYEQVPSPKLAAAGSRPESRAAWDALDAGLANIRTFIAAQNELATEATSATTVPPAALLDVTIDAAPTGAEIYVDGAFRGHAPLTLQLPARALRIRIILDGYEVWEKSVMPEAGMRIQPVLKAIPAAPVSSVAPAAPVPATPAATPLPESAAVIEPAVLPNPVAAPAAE